MTDPLRLYVLPPSHYCERARWALDHLGLRYDEERWAVGLHVRAARRLAPRTTVPILAAGGRAIQGSGAILDWLGMPGGAPALERRFESRIGVLVRQFVYAGTLGDARSGVQEALLHGVPARQARLGRLLWPVTRRLMASAMQARPGLVPELEARIEAELDWFEAELGGRDHLVDGRFGRADLTAASLLSPLARPAALPLYGRVRLPERLEAALQRWAGRPAIRWVARTYAAHRC